MGASEDAIRLTGLEPPGHRFKVITEGERGASIFTATLACECGWQHIEASEQEALIQLAVDGAGPQEGLTLLILSLIAARDKHWREVRDKRGKR